MRVDSGKGDIMIAEIEGLEEMDASELHARRLNAKEVLTPMKGDNLKIPVADGTVKTPGGNRCLKPSTSPNPLQDDSTRDDAEAENDFWSYSGDSIYRHHVEPTVNTFVIRMYCWKSILMITGTGMKKENYRMIFLLNERPLEGHTCSGERLVRKQTTSRHDNVWPDMWKDMSDAAKNKAKQKWAIEKPKFENAKQIRGIFFIEK